MDSLSCLNTRKPGYQEIIAVQDQNSMEVGVGFHHKPVIPLCGIRRCMIMACRFEVGDGS
jgi:hypothetical protein